MNPTLTEEQLKNEQIAQVIRFGDNKALSVATSQPSISAKDLINPVTKVTPPTPAVNTNDGSRLQGLVSNVAGSTQNFITSQSENAKKEQEMAALLGQQSYSGTVQREQFNKQYALPENLARLQDIQLQLGERNKQTALTKAEATAGGAGAIQAERALTLADKQASIRDAGLAAEAAVLQGNIETASTLINQAMDDYYNDRQLNNQNMLAQLNYYSGKVNQETQQLINQETRKYEEDQAKVQRVLDSVDAALSSGAATSEDMRILTNPKATDEDRLAVAQNVIARSEAQMRALDVGQKEASAAASWALANQSSEVTPGETVTTPGGGQVEIPTFDSWLSDNVDVYGPLQLGEVEKYQKEYDDEITIMQQANSVAKLSPLSREVVNNPQAYYDFTPTQRATIFKELAKVGLDTNQIISGKKKALPATQVESISQGMGVKADVEKLYTMLKELPGTGPIAGRLQALDPYNPKRIAIEAQITRIVPGLARGIFNEVGVLTDQDVERYRNTLANPNMTDEQIDLLHRDTLSKIDQSIIITLDTFSMAGYDTTNFTEKETDTMSDDDAYEEYLRVIGQKQ